MIVDNNPLNCSRNVYCLYQQVGQHLDRNDQSYSIQTKSISQSAQIIAFNIGHTNAASEVNMSNPKSICIKIIKSKHTECTSSSERG